MAVTNSLSRDRELVVMAQQEVQVVVARATALVCLEVEPGLAMVVMEARHRAPVLMGVQVEEVPVGFKAFNAIICCSINTSVEASDAASAFFTLFLFF
jgi:hypothetical protein